MKNLKVFWKIISNENITEVLKFCTPFDLNSFDSQVRQILASCNKAYTHLA
jgi:hypothetical protein